MSEQQTQAIANLKNFMRTLMEAGCTPDFVIERGFDYAIRSLKEVVIERCILSGESCDGIADTSTGWMDRAALWLVVVTRDLQINPEARKANYEQ
jgi:hypothetical protein